MQVDIKPALAHFQISTTSMVAAVQHVRQLIDLDADFDLSDNLVLKAAMSDKNPIDRAKYIVQGIFGAEIEFTNYDEACITTQALVEHAFKTDGIIEDVDLAVMAAHQRVKTFIAKPENKFYLMMNYGRGHSSTPVITEQREVGGIQTAVAVNNEGGFKKGEKERLAMELYKKFLAEDKDATDPKKTNQKFIAILMKELGMTKAGATTYNYNMKKKMNPDMVTAKPKRK